MVKLPTDLLLAGAALLLLSPLLLAIAVAIVASSGRPVFYRGARAGLDGKIFRIFKFRTMVPGSENLGGPSTANNDPRLTRVGTFLRRSKLDELPQLLNILVGEMSVVGPRPQVQHYTDLYEDEMLDILSVRPGLTDYASIEFINLDAVLGDVDVDEYYRTYVEPRKNELRLRYVRERSFITDMKLIVLTMVAFLKLPHRWRRAARESANRALSTTSDLISGSRKQTK